MKLIHPGVRRMVGPTCKGQLVEPRNIACQNTCHGNSDKKSVSVATYLSVVAEKKIILIIQVRLESFELYQDSQQRIGKFRLSCGWFISYNPTGAKVHRCRFTVSSGTMWWPYMRKNDSAPSHVIKNWFGENFCGCANSISFPEFDALN